MPGAATPVGSAVVAYPAVRRWAFRVASAVLVPVLLLSVLEGGLRLAGYGHPTAFLLSAKMGGEAVHVENPKFGWRFFGPRLARTPLPMVLRDAKPPGTCRIFVFGESAAYGDPQPAFGLARQLEVLLRARFPGTRFEVVNVAMTAINSHVILPIARDCARRDGDVWVLYMGNNEVVGPFGAGTVFGPPTPGLARLRAGLAFKATRTGQALEALGDWLRPGADPARAMEWGGMQMFLEHEVPSGDPRLATVYHHFARNLEDVIRTGRGSGARVVVSTVAVNLRDCAPFASRHRPDLAGAALEEWDRLYQAGVKAQAAGQPEQAVEWFRQASARDDQFAELPFRWGRCLLELGEVEAAQEQFKRARDLDVLRFRCDSRLNAVFRRLAEGREREGVFFADGEAALAGASAAGVTGSEFLYEHVHLRFEGNYRLARCLAEQVARALPAALTQTSAPDWLGLDACAEQLGWTDRTRHEGASQMLARLTDPPFTAQLNHHEQVQRLVGELMQTRGALQPAALETAAAAQRERLRQTPDDPWLLGQLAGIEMRRGQGEAAAEAWRRLLELRPHDLEARGQLGRCLLMAGRDAAAESEFKSVLREDPDSIEAREGLAFVQVRRQAHAAAIVEYEELLRRRPFYSPSHLSVGALLMAQGLAEEGRQHYRLAVAHPLNTGPARRAVGLVCLEQGWFAEAVTNLGRAVRLDPTDAAAHLRLGQAFAALGRPTEAAASYAEAVRWGPGSAEAQFRLGFELGRQGKDGEALPHFTEAVRLDPGMLPARLNLGIALYRQGQAAEARNQFEAVLRQDPTNQIARQYLERTLNAPDPRR